MKSTGQMWGAVKAVFPKLSLETAVNSASTLTRSGANSRVR